MNYLKQMTNRRYYIGKDRPANHYHPTEEQDRGRLHVKNFKPHQRIHYIKEEPEPQEPLVFSDELQNKINNFQRLVNQPVNNQMASPYTIAEEMLGASSAQRGLAGMERTAAPKGPNMMDSGAASKVSVNTQPYNNSRLQEQNILQNTTSAVPQAEADAIMDVRKQRLVGDNAEYKANEFAEERKAEVLSVLGSPATQAMASMTPPEAAKFRNDIATGKAMAMGANPDLVQNAIGNERYA